MSRSSCSPPIAEAEEFQPLVSPRAEARLPQVHDWYRRVEAEAPVYPEDAAQVETIEAPGFRQPSEPAGPPGATDLQFPSLDELARQQSLRSARRSAAPEVEALLEQARQETEQARTEARTAAREASRAGHEEGYSAGYALGHAEGLRQGRQQAAEEAASERAALRAAVDSLVNRVEEERQRAWDSLEPQVLELVLEVAKTVLKQEVEASRTAAISQIRSAVRRAAHASSLRVRVNAADLEAAQAVKEELLELVDGLRGIEIAADRRVPAGGCVVETESGDIDARLSTQIEEVEAALRAAPLRAPEAA